ncbi:MAG: ABC transporter permease subunit [Bacteroidales bacterium]
MGKLCFGSHQTQTIRRVALPEAYPNIITGLILSIGRVSGETAPILFYGSSLFPSKIAIQFIGSGNGFTYHLYVLATSGTNMEQSRMAYGTAFVLIAIVLIINTAASLLRRYLNKKVKNELV